MLRRNKERYCPVHWSHGITNSHDEAVVRHASSDFLVDRYNRGMKTWSKLLDLPWYAWREDRIVLVQLEGLRQEYRLLLRDLVDAGNSVVNVPFQL